MFTRPVAEGALSAVLFDHDVTQFRTCEVEAGVKLAVDDDTAAEPGAQGDHHGNGSACCNACHCFCLGCCVCVVFNVNRLAVHQSGQIGSQRILQEGNVVGVFHHTGHIVCGTGSRHTDESDLVHPDPHFFHELTGQLCHIRNNGIGTPFGLCGYAALLHDFEFFVYKTDGNIGTAKVNADSIHSKSCLSCSAPDARAPLVLL